MYWIKDEIPKLATKRKGYIMKLSESEKIELRKIYSMSQFEMANLWRFAPAGHPWFNSTLPYFKHFNRRFKRLGGMTSEISKQIGW